MTQESTSQRSPWQSPIVKYGGGCIVLCVALLAVGGVVIALRRPSRPAASQVSKATAKSGARPGGTSQEQSPKTPAGLAEQRGGQAPSETLKVPPDPGPSSVGSPELTKRLQDLDRIPDDGRLKDGFRDLKWGDQPTVDPNLRFKNEPVAGLKIYEREADFSDQSKMGNVPTAIGYQFYKGRFFVVTIQASRDNYPILKSFLEANWGVGKSEKANVASWATPRTYARVKEDIDGCNLVIASQVINAEFSEDEKLRAVAKKKDL